MPINRFNSDSYKLKLEEDVTMSYRRVSAICVMTALVVAVQARALRAGNNEGDVVTVAFGAGLNTAQPGNSANHHVIPSVIKVKTGGVVNFAVAGFHWIFVYNPGKQAADVVVADPAATFINDMTNLYYGGLSPVATPSAVAAAPNKIETVLFPKAGRYLVICNVTGHFKDGMFAFIEVSGGDNQEGQNHH